MPRTRDDLINQAFTRASLESLLDRQNSPLEISKNPLITIARDPGSGGSPIAKTLARKLGFKFYDQDLIEAIAKSAHKRAKVVAKVDEKTRSLIQDIAHSLFNPEYISDITYIKHLTNTLLSITNTGRAVIIGRGSNLIIPKNDALHVYITAPRKTRVHRAMLFEKISRQKARDIIIKVTKQRRQFVSRYFNKNYQNPIYYDLTLNTHYFDIDTAADIVISAFHKKFPTFKK